MEEKKSTVMTPEEFAQKMDELRGKYYIMNGDEECCHSRMDDLMCELLDQLGYGKGVDIFNVTPKWYS